MQKRNTQQRRRDILQRLHTQGEIAVDELAAFFATSAVTIRKDLTELEREGWLIRTFGGAVALPREASERDKQKVSKRKLAIARAAANLVQDGQRIVVDSGSTTAALLPELRQKRDLVVMTNSLQVASQLLEWEPQPKVLMTGGTWDPQSRSFQGQMAEQILRAYTFDQAFLGATGLDLQRGTTTFNELTQLSQVMAANANAVIIMAESEKLQHKIPNVELPWQAISVLVTDTGIDAQAKQIIEQHGVRVICANENGA